MMHQGRLLIGRVVHHQTLSSNPAMTSYTSRTCIGYAALTMGTTVPQR